MNLCRPQGQARSGKFELHASTNVLMILCPIFQAESAGCVKRIREEALSYCCSDEHECSHSAALQCHFFGRFLGRIKSVLVGWCDLQGIFAVL